MKGHPTTEEYGGSDSGNNKHIKILCQIEEAEAHTRILCMITCGKFALSLGFVERTTVSLRITCNEEYEKSHYCRDMSFEYKPSVSLRFNNTRQLHRSCKCNCRDKAKTERHLVRNHLNSTTHRRHDTILIVRSPTCEEYTYNSKT